MADTAAPLETKPVVGKSKNGYYYWHGHEKERKELGDVAPLPTHVALASDAPRTPTEHVSAIDKYSWCNNTKSVSVYVDCEGAAEGNTEVRFETALLVVRVRGANGEVKQLKLPLAKECDAEKSTFRFKPDQIVVKLQKAKEDETWFDLVARE